MSKEKEVHSIRDLLGKQVIDNRGSLVGVIKDIKLSVGGQEAITIIELKDGAEATVTWSEIQSIEDFVLLKKSVKIETKEVSKPEKPPKPKESVELVETPPIPPPSMICPNCGAKIPSHAKFCAKCGRKLK